MSVTFDMNNTLILKNSKIELFSLQEDILP